MSIEFISEFGVSGLYYFLMLSSPLQGIQRTLSAARGIPEGQSKWQ